jgi:phosphopantothenoylcysteine decarboxylase / phosphopantothenate---cysteine ligase
VLRGKKIVIGISASIAAYKIPLLVRLLVKEGAEVQTILTENARDFVTPLTLSTLSRRPALTYPFNRDDGVWHSHVDMGLWADAMIIAPATAATLSKMASGLADNLLVATYLSAKCPVFFAPAMDLDMYKHPSTGENINRLVHRGNILIEPQTGELASGLCGAGRMEEPENILQEIKKHFSKSQDFAGRKFLITAGPTHEAIDPVRFLGNHSSGKMGFALAETAAMRGAEVTLIAGPVNIEANHPDIKRIDVISAREMFEAVNRNFTSADIIIMAAAVADYAPAKPSAQKIKKDEATKSILLKKTDDILAWAGSRKNSNQILVGFALETENELENAIKKINNKNPDLIVLNSLREKGAGFGTSTNKITILDKKLNRFEFGLKSKKEVADDILDKISGLF